jgi:hypothetical protein
MLALGLQAAEDTITGPVLTAVWGAYAILGIGSWSVHKLIIPARLRARPYSVTGVTEEAPGVWSVFLQPAA